MGENLPIYKLLITEDDSDGIEWSYTAFVDKPATGELMIAFNAQPELKVEFKTISEEKRIVMGALMVANLPILRRDEKTKQEFLVVLDPENIDKALQKFFRKGNQKNVNEMHDPAKKVGGVYMYQAWIINSELGITTPKGFNEVPDGSAFGVFKVDNDEVWQKVKDGTYQGFSIEGKMLQEPMPEPSDKEINDFISALEGSNL
mgnify:FL=1|jgi:hypothetical protein